MYGKSTYSRGGNGSRIQNNHQSQGNNNQFNTRMGDEQHRDPGQDDVNIQPAPAPQAPQESQYSSPCRIIPPDPAKREKILRLARKEQEDYERYKESMKLGPIHLTPKETGGKMTESEARQQQQQIQAQSKYQKMLQREEYKRKQKEEEEAQIQKMKDIQRKKAEKLEEKRCQEDLERSQRWHEDRYTRNNEFLDRLQPINHSYHRDFRQPSRRATNQEEDEDRIPGQAWKPSHEMGKNQAVKQERTMQKMREMDNEDEWPYTAVKQEQDEDYMFQQALKASLLMHKMEEETKLKEIKKSQHKQANQQTYRQQQKEEAERRSTEMKDEQRRKAEVIKQHEEERTLSQQEEQRRVNNAFLDRLQSQNTSKQGYSGDSNTWD